MTRLEKIILLITFYLSSVSEDKANTWQHFADLPMDEENLLTVIAWITDDLDDLDWSLLDGFKQETLDNLK